MVLKSLLFAMLISAAASGKPRLRGTPASDVNEGASHMIERAAVSNQISTRAATADRERDVTNPCRFPAASRAMNQNPDPDSNDARVQGVPSHRSSSESSTTRPARPCVDEPDATLPGDWDCARIAEYISSSDVHSCSWAGPWLSVMVAPRLAEEAAEKCPLSCNECAPDDDDEEPAKIPPPLPTPKANPCPKPYTQSGKFCCFGPPMAPECYKWTD